MDQAHYEPWFIPHFFGLPSGVGYEAEPECVVEDNTHVHDLDGAERLIRVLVLRPQPAAKKGALLFSETDMARVEKKNSTDMA